MKVILQRVLEASVEVEKNVIGNIDFGYVALVGFGQDDADDYMAKFEYIADKILGLRLFEDQYGKMNLSLTDVGGDILLVSQFTLYADCKKGRRPSFVKALPPQEAKEMYEKFVAYLRKRLDESGSGGMIATGEFGAYMKVSLINDGPVTIILDKH